MKKIVLMVAAGALMFLLAACGRVQTGAEEPSSGLEEGVNAVESAIREGTADMKNTVSNTDDLRNGTSEYTVGTPDDFPSDYNYGTGKISDWSRADMLRKLPEHVGGWADSSEHPCRPERHTGALPLGERQRPCQNTVYEQHDGVF